MQLFFALTKGNKSTRKSMQRKVVIVVEKSHLHYAAPEIVISRYFFSFFIFVFLYYFFSA